MKQIKEKNLELWKDLEELESSLIEEAEVLIGWEDNPDADIIDQIKELNPLMLSAYCQYAGAIPTIQQLGLSFVIANLRRMQTNDLDSLSIDDCIVSALVGVGNAMRRPMFAQERSDLRSALIEILTRRSDGNRARAVRAYVYGCSFFNNTVSHLTS